MLVESDEAHRPVMTFLRKSSPMHLADQRERSDTCASSVAPFRNARSLFHLANLSGPRMLPRRERRGERRFLRQTAGQGRKRAQPGVDMTATMRSVQRADAPGVDLGVTYWFFSLVLHAICQRAGGRWPSELPAQPKSHAVDIAITPSQHRIHERLKRTFLPIVAGRKLVADHSAG